MLDRMSSHEISEWRLFFKLEAADMKQMTDGGGGSGGAGGSQRVITMGNPAGVDVGPR